MKYLILILISFCWSTFVVGQNIERKIIIENGNYFYTTIDEEFQIATLHTGKSTESLSEAKRFAMPAGRNYDAPINPFSWDLSNGFIYAINFLAHPLNDRNEALKKFKLTSLQEWDSTVTAIKMLMQSVDQNNFAMNDPYLFTTKRSNILTNFYFDGIAINDSSYCMVMTNNGEITVWNCIGKTWTHSEPMNYKLDGYFSLFKFKNKIYIHFRHGFIHEIVLGSKIGMKVKRSEIAPTNGILIDNRDEKTIQFLSNQQIDKEIPLNELIKNKAITIF